MRTFPFTLSLIWLLGLAALTPAPILGQDEGPSLIVLVRHAERAGPSADDPGLTPVGAERAQMLARLLEDAGITQIHSTDTRRTLETGLPLARNRGLEIERYDPRDLEGFAAHLLTLPGRHLVVGHSNTTDALSVLLGGTSHGPIIEAWEYDRLYLLTPRAEGGMETVMIRFGQVPDIAPRESGVPSQS
jgi:phosphohistidine phosphatase SixA